MDTFQIKRGDTGPAIRYALSPASIDLTGATVRFKMAPVGGETVLDQIAAVITTSPPVVEYAWAEADTATAGRYNAEWEVTYSDATVETFPNKGFLMVSVNPDLP
jgi:hypothetical protein